MTCLIIEDQPPAQRILQRFIADAGQLELVGTYSDPVAALAALQERPVDLLFLDVHLPKMSGMDFLRTAPRLPAVILTTAFPDFAVESYEYGVVDYLLKPFSFARFMQAVAKVTVVAPAEAPAPADIFLKSGYDFIRIAPRDIHFIRADGDYTEIHLPNKRHLSGESLKHWVELLEKYEFVRAHKSYVVNLRQVEKATSTHLHLPGGRRIPLGRAYKDKVAAHYRNRT